MRKYKKRFSFGLMFEKKYKKFSIFKIYKFPPEIKSFLSLRQESSIP